VAIAARYPADATGAVESQSAKLETSASMTRLIAAIAGIGLLAAVTLFGISVRDDSKLVLWFGLAAAVLAPVGVALIGYAITAGERRQLARLTHVTEIEQLIAKADDAQTRLRLLEEQRNNLQEAVRIEAARIAMHDRRDALEQNAIQILEELAALDVDFAEANAGATTPEVREALTALEERVEARRRGNIVLTFRGRQYVIDPSPLTGLPFLGIYFQPIVWSLRSLERSRRGRSDSPQNTIGH
jgi:hypothetical protein